MIDSFNHFMPKAYLDRLGDFIPGHPVLTAFPRLRTLWDVDARRALLDEFGDMQNVLSLANPPPELIARMQAVCAEAIKDAKVMERLDAAGAVLVADKPADFTAWLEGQRTLLGKLIVDGNIKLG